MEKKILVNKWFPRKFNHSELKWYERNGLLTCHDSMKSEEFQVDTDNHFKKGNL